MYKIEMKIKNYAKLSIYTEYNSIKDKIIDKNCSIKRTIPITDVTLEYVYDGCIEYNDAIMIFYNENKMMTYDKKYNVAILNVKENELRFPDLVYVAISMFSKILQEKNRYLLHSSALKYDSNNAFALVGDANAGKTSLAYELINKYGCKLISNDHSIIGIENGEPKILGGTKEIQMRLGAIELYFPELFKKLDVITDNKWEKKIIVNDIIDIDSIVTPEEDKANLTAVYNINTSNGSETFLRKRERIDEVLFLYESFSKIIKGTYNYITGFNYAMP